MIKMELNYKCHVVQDMILQHYLPISKREVYTLVSYNLELSDEKIVYITYYLFRLLSKNKRLWCSLPFHLSCLNYVLKHLRFMLTNVDPGGLKQYARDNFFTFKHVK